MSALQVHILTGRKEQENTLHKGACGRGCLSSFAQPMTLRETIVLKCLLNVFDERSASCGCTVYGLIRQGIPKSVFILAGWRLKQHQIVST